MPDRFDASTLPENQDSMQISTKFTTAVHVLIAIEYFRDDEKITSDMLAGTVGSNPVIIRNIMSQLKEAGLIEVRPGPRRHHASEAA